MPGCEDVTVSEIMVSLSEYPYVYDDDTLKDAIIVLKRHRMREGIDWHRSVLVFSRTQKVQGEERLVGILTIRDVLNAIRKNKALSENRELLAMGWAYFYRRDPLLESMVVKVGSAVRPLVKAYAQAEDSVTKAIEVMMAQKVNLVPVFRNKRVVGIVRAIDILDHVSGMLISDGGVPADGLTGGDSGRDRGSWSALWSAAVPAPGS